MNLIAEDCSLTAAATSFVVKTLDVSAPSNTCQLAIVGSHFWWQQRPSSICVGAVDKAPKTGYNTKVGGDRQPMVERSIAFCLAELAGYRNVSVLFSSAVSPLIQHGVRVFKTDLPKMGEVS